MVAVMPHDLQQIVDTANSLTFGIDVHSDVNKWNDKIAEITGLLEEESMGTPCVSTVSVPMLLQLFQDILEYALFGHQTYNYWHWHK